MKIRSRIFLVFLLIASAGLGSLVYWVATELRPRYLEAQEEPLVDTAYLLAELLRKELQSPKSAGDSLSEAFDRLYQRRFNARVYELDRDRVDIRVYLTDARGIVVFDSAGKDLGRDYSRWNDVLRALKGEYGARSTAEDPDNPDGTTSYVSAPVLDEGRVIGVVAIGKPKRNLSYFVANAQRELLLAGAVVLAVTLVLGLVLYAWVSRPLRQLTGYARSVTSGQRAVMPRFGNDEIGAMAQALEQMQTALEGKDYVERYVQTLTHELKSPLAAIRAAGELLSEPLPPEQRQRFLENIAREVVRLQNLVDRMLQLAAVEKRTHIEQPESIEVAALVQEIVEGLRSIVTTRGLDLHVKVSLGTKWHGERFLLRQAVENLVRNALDFSSPSGQIQVTANLVDGKSVLCVRDHGPGMPDFAAARLFERFYSLARPDGTKGTGLGLTFAREVAELHGGSLVVANAASGGVEARLTLPA
ncbi:MAG: two-component system sensor histidine kinase CreC [Nevskiales bacterium]